MIKDIPNAEKMNAMHIEAMLDRNRVVYEGLINQVNEALMHAAENGCNEIDIVLKTIEDNCQDDITDFEKYYLDKGFKLTHLPSDIQSLLKISFRKDSDPSKVWLGDYRPNKKLQ